MHRLLVAAFSLLATLAIHPRSRQEKCVARWSSAWASTSISHYNLPRADLLDVLETFKREAVGGVAQIDDVPRERRRQSGRTAL